MSIKNLTRKEKIKLAKSPKTSLEIMNKLARERDLLIQIAISQNPAYMRAA